MGHVRLGRLVLAAAARRRRVRATLLLLKVEADLAPVRRHCRRLFLTSSRSSPSGGLSSLLTATTTPFLGRSSLVALISALWGVVLGDWWGVREAHLPQQDLQYPLHLPIVAWRQLLYTKVDVTLAGPCKKVAQELHPLCLDKTSKSIH